MNELNTQGFPVVLITPEKKYYIEKTIRDTNVTFPIIHDNLNYIMVNFKVAVKAPLAVKESVDLEEFNETDDPVLPVPATYIIGDDGKIKYGHFSMDFSNKSSFKQIASKVLEIKNSKSYAL